MQNNDFEKQVQKKMEELRYVPAANVWHRIEASLPNEKKRRWLFFLLLFGALSTASLLWLNSRRLPVQNISEVPVQKKNMVSAGDKNYNTVQPSHEEINNTTGLKTGDPVYKSPDPVPVENKIEPVNNPNIIAASNAEYTMNNTGNKNNSPVKDQVNPSTSRILSEKIYRDRYLKQPSVLESLAKIKTTVQSPGLTEEENPARGKENQFKEKNNAGDFIAKTIKTRILDSVVEKSSKKEIIALKEKADSSTNASASNSTVKKKSKPWQYSIQFGFGVPYTKNGINDIVFSDNSTSLLAPASNISGNQPSTPSPGMVFQTGITLEKNLVGRLHLKTGLNYVYLSNHIRIGNKIESLSGNGVTTYGNDNGIIPNTPGIINYYNNYFRFIQAPLAFQYEAIKKDQFAFFLEGGASMDYLVSSDALLFNGASNTYSTSKNIFNKVLYSGLGGIGIKMAQQTRMPVTIGYQFSYGLKPFLKNAGTQQHMPVSLLYFRIYLNNL